MSLQHASAPLQWPKANEPGTDPSDEPDTEPSDELDTDPSDEPDTDSSDKSDTDSSDELFPKVSEGTEQHS